MKSIPFSVFNIYDLHTNPKSLIGYSDIKILPTQDQITEMADHYQNWWEGADGISDPFIDWNEYDILDQIEQDVKYDWDGTDSSLPSLHKLGFEHISKLRAFIVDFVEKRVPPEENNYLSFYPSVDDYSKFYYGDSE